MLGICKKSRTFYIHIHIFLYCQTFLFSYTWHLATNHDFSQFESYHLLSRSLLLVSHNPIVPLCNLNISFTLLLQGEKYNTLSELTIGRSATLHYRLRSVEGGQFRLVNFASHFIRVQIFQIDFPLILYL